jgi:hypothetical protein
MKTYRKFGKKFVSSLVNVLLVLGVLIVLFPLSTPTVKATTIIYGDWTVTGQESHSNEVFILYGDLIITTGNLTLDNCTIKMALGSPDPGRNITVGFDGTFNLLNNSLITTYSTSPDPYEFRIDGTAMIENSTVEKMKDIDSADANGHEDGIRIYSDDVEIKNSTIRHGSDTGVFVKNGKVSITNSNIQNNNFGILLWSNSSDNYIEDNNVLYNTHTGILLEILQIQTIIF